MNTTNKSRNRIDAWKYGSWNKRTALLISLLFFGLLFFGAEMFAQNTIPAGTILPIQLNASLNSKKSKAGQVVTARIMQNVPLPSGTKIHAGDKIVGHIIDVAGASHGSGARLSIQFDTLEVSQRRIPITTSLRALASMVDVEQSQSPNTGPDGGTSEYEWVTEQIGGDTVYGRGGPVTNGSRVVGRSTGNGVLVRAASRPGTECNGDPRGNNMPQALWVFSADACGPYGFADLKIAHAGRSNPVGKITLVSERRDFDVRSGSGLLLRVR